MIKHEFLIGFIVAVVLVSLMFFVEQMAHVSQENGEKSERIRIARIEACKAITDEAIRALCVVEGGRGEGAQ